MFYNIANLMQGCEFMEENKLSIQNELAIEDIKNLIDYWVCILAFIFDLYFKSSLKYIKDKNYIDILIDKIEYKNEETKARMEDIRKCAKKYIEDNI